MYHLAVMAVRSLQQKELSFLPRPGSSLCVCVVCGVCVVCVWCVCVCDVCGVCVVCVGVCVVCVCVCVHFILSFKIAY